MTSPRVAARSPPSVVTPFSLPLLFVCLRVRACPCAIVSAESRPSGRRSLGRMAVGVWPYGLWTLAAWRGLILHARSGAPVTWGRMVFNPPGPCPPTCSRPAVVPHVPSPPPGLRLPFWRASWCASSTAGVELRATAASGANALCGRRSGPEAIEARDAAGVVSNNDTSVDGRIASSLYTSSSSRWTPGVSRASCGGQGDGLAEVHPVRSTTSTFRTRSRRV